MLYADPRWLIAVVDGGLVAAGGETEVEISLEAPAEARLRLLECLAGGADPSLVGAAAGAGLREAESLLAELREAGALSDRPVPEELLRGIGLRDAILASARTEPVGRLVWTAEELLVLPDGLGAEAMRATIRAFVAGLRGDARLRAYCWAADRRVPSTRGDRPDPQRLERALEATDRGNDAAVQVVRLSDGHVESAPADRIGSLGASIVHRLSTVVAETGQEILRGLHHRAALHATPTLRGPRPAAERICRGTAADLPTASLIARAEAAERYAAGDAGRRHRLRRACGAELPGALGMDELLRFTPRQLASMPAVERYSPEDPRLWVRAEGLNGTERWVPAEAVFCPFRDPERDRSLTAGATTSGVAAHVQRGQAIENAVCELIERDTFMWHWVQRVSRERIERGGLPEDTRRLIGRIEAEGVEVDLVNLTLETLPAVLCVLTTRGGVFLGCACRRDAAGAAAKALTEAYAVAWTELMGRPRPDPIDAERVRGPGDHLRFNRQEEARAGSDFLRSSPDTIRPAEIEPGRGPIAEEVEPLGEALVVELGSSATRPFHVIRALVPGAIPLSFGYDREPLGMPGLGRPRTTLDGRTLGRPADIESAAPVAPHPFG